MGGEGQGLESQHLPLAARDGRRRRHHLQGLDADAEVAGLVVARFVGQDHAGLQRRGVGRLGDALRPLVHAEIAAHPVAGAVVIVQPRHPQRLARQPVQGRAGGAGGKADAGEARYGPSAPGVKRSRIFRTRLADGHGAGDVGGAVPGTGAPESTSRSWPGSTRRLVLVGGTVVDDGAVGAGAGDGVEAEVLQGAGRLAEGLQPRDHLHLVGRAGLGVGGTAQCRNRATAAPSRMWARRAPSTSTAFLQARGRAQGSAPRTTVAPAPSKVSKYQAEDWAGSTSTRPPRQLRQRPLQRLRPLQGDRVAEPGRQVGSELLRIEGTAGRTRPRAGSPGRAAGASGSRRRREG